MNEKFVKAILADEIAPGGMKTVELDGQEITICNCDGIYYAVQRRCGHMNAPLEMGTLCGIYLTCPMHCAQFDVTNGKAISGPVPADIGTDPIPPRIGAFLQNVGMLMSHIHTEPIRTFTTKVESGWVEIAL